MKIDTSAPRSCSVARPNTSQGANALRAARLACAFALAAGTLVSLAAAQPPDEKREATISVPKRVEASVSKDAGSPLKYEKYTLPNGMTVILHEDHTLPVATINTWYHVGAKNEPKGRSGFAHLFEHLMFMGTKRVPGGDFDTIMESGGGANNASTSLDRTNYFSYGPSSLLPTLLWLDAERLEAIGPTMTTEKLRKQQDVVRNEIRQQVENTPYGRANEYSLRFMYPEGHPYHWNVYGTHEDLEAANVEIVKNFFASFYAPNNASLVVAGDFDPAAVKPLVAELFGTLPRGNVAPDAALAPVKLDRVIRTTMLDKVQLPMLMICYHTPPAYQPGDAELTLAGAVLADGQSSRLYERLVVKDELATAVSAGQESSQLGSIFRIVVTGKPGADLAKIEAIVDEELGRLAHDGPTSAELKARQTQVELGTLASLQSVMSRADKLNEYEYYFGEPDSLKRDLERYRNAGTGAVKAAAGMLKPDARLIIQVLPEETARGASARDKRPADAAVKAFTAPAPEEFALSNGVKVMFWPRPGSALVQTRAEFMMGIPLDAPETAGLVGLANAMLEEGVNFNGKSLDGAAYSAALQQLGATVGAGGGRESGGVALTTLARTFKDAAPLWAAAVKSPRMDATDFARVKAIHLENLKQEDDEPTAVAAKVGMRELFGPTNPYGVSMGGSMATVTPLTLENIKGYEAGIMRPENCTILLAGDVTRDEAKRILEDAFGTWKVDGHGPSRVAFSASMPTRSEMRVVLVDRPGAVQTVINYYMPGAKADSADRVKMRLMNTILGGSFTSRLNQNLREKHGFTYGAGTRVSATRHTGWYVARANVVSDSTGAALKEFMGEFARIRAGDVTAEELDKARKTARTEMIQTFATLGGYIGAGMGLLEDNLPWSTLSTDMAALETATLSDVNAVAKSGIPLEKGVLVLVGDQTLILSKIKEAGVSLPKIEIVDAAGVPVATK
ncbi:pitrilysin family protein [soil metagenome]